MPAGKERRRVISAADWLGRSLFCAAAFARDQPLDDSIGVGILDREATRPVAANVFQVRPARFEKQCGPTTSIVFVFFLFFVFRLLLGRLRVA
jgi:hypothetical protein